MGILGYPNMDDNNNHDGIFGDYSEIYSNYSNEENNAQVSQESVVPSLEQPVQEEPVVENDAETFSQIAPQTERQSGNRLLFYIVILGLLFVAAVGMFLYRKHSEMSAPQEQSMGDYFYDQAASQVANTDPLQGATATIDVDLSEPVVQPSEEVAQVAENVTKADIAVKKEVEEKVDESTLTAVQKAELKKKADAEKESQVTLSNNSVIVPVSTGGRVDPFVPYYQIASVAMQDKYELLAPPAIVPAVDPAIDELMSTKISGIMYDSTRPSAIVNVGGSDYLIHKGDTVKGFKVTDITKDYVVMQYKANTYRATVGQAINDGLNINPVSNIQSSFGGAYKQTPANVIQF